MKSELIFTKNEEQNLAGCLESVHWSDDDSGSADATVAIARCWGERGSSDVARR
jgi:hypothetical protein